MPRRRSRNDTAVTGETYGPLTEKGYRLMRTSPLTDQYRAMPTVPGGGAVPMEESTRVVRPAEVRQPYPGPFFGPRMDAETSSDVATLQNLLPSRKHPDPWSLGDRPLRELYDSRPVRDDDDEQFRAVGRLVIHDDPVSWDRPAFGSAWVVGRYLIATCAHNLFDSNRRRFARSIEFYPGFDYYAQPFGLDGTAVAPVQCRVTEGRIPASFLNNPATNDDIAVCRVDRPIGDIIGVTIPVRPPNGPDYFDDHRVIVAGYPAGSEFDFGKRLWLSRGDYLFARRGGPDDDFAPVVATNFGGGASGGPWLVRVGDGSLRAVGLTSGHARVRYGRGELNLMSLQSPRVTAERWEKLQTDAVVRRFEV